MTRAEELFTRMHYLSELTNEEILELQEDIRDFFQSDEPEEDKKELFGYTENLTMVCNAIREGGLENRKPIKSTKPRKKVTFELEIPEILKPKEKNK